ncbi:MAG: type I secretion C-terminal target domain-containing protein, partial [Gammaproteobacteria bacterium]|nr:type I secretion C-terminal target domain-containing protein [Gammaproteobacteria bacterium]
AMLVNYNGDYSQYISVTDDGTGKAMLAIDVDGSGDFTNPDHNIILANQAPQDVDLANLVANSNLVLPLTETIPPIEGTTGADLINGTEASEVINALAGGDTVYAGSGADTIEGGAGADTIYGEAGNDIINGDNPLEASANTYKDELHGGADDDILHGYFANDTLYGDDGNDQLFGDNRHDLLNGGAGNDTLEGNLGTDTLTGGTGADVFKLGADVIDDTRVTTITDFSPTEGDTIDVSEVIPAYNGNYAQYVDVIDDGNGNAQLVFDNQGGGDFSVPSHTITLNNLAPTEVDLSTLIINNNLILE